MKYLIKPYEVTNTNNLGFARSNSYIAEAVEGEVMVQPKVVGTEGVVAQINVGVYSIERDADGGFDINDAKLQEVRVIKESDLTQAGVPIANQQQIYAGLTFGDLATQQAIVSQLIGAFGLELA